MNQFTRYTGRRAVATGGKTYASWSLDQLLKVRGAMWTARMNIGYGPRPFKDDNILAMDYYQWYDKPTRERMIAHYGPASPRKYTHAVTGPFIDGGYHGQYPTLGHVPTQAEFDHYLDCMQEWCDADIVPVHFAHQDGMNDPSEMAALDVLYRQPRAQALLPIVIYPGWEPVLYEWENSTWVKWLAHGRSVFPNAVMGPHFRTDCDAPTGGNDQNNNMTNGQCWRNVAPYIDAAFMQYGGYVFADPPNEVPTESFKVALHDAVKDMKRRFSDPAYAGDWPKQGRTGRPIAMIAAEYAAFGDYWQNWAEAYARDLGDLCLAAGADGVLDGAHL